MSNHVNVPISNIHVLHFGSQSNYEKLCGSYFEEEINDEDVIMNKSIIVSVIYKPDIVYENSDGYGGRCWVAEIIDSKEDGKNIYYFRNFIDLVKMYEEKGYKFILHTGNMFFIRNDLFDKLNIHYDNPLENFRTLWGGR